MKKYFNFVFLSIIIILTMTACAKTSTEQKENEKPENKISAVEVPQSNSQKEKTRAETVEDNSKETKVAEASNDEEDEKASKEAEEKAIAEAVRLKEETEKAKATEAKKAKEEEQKKADAAAKLKAEETKKKAADDLTKKRNKILSEVTFKSVDETVYATERLNVRKGPSTDFELIGELKANQKAKRTGIGSNGWSRIEYEGQIGYASGNYLSKNQIENPKVSASKDKWSYSRKGLDIKIKKYKEYIEGGNVVYWVAEIKSNNISRDINTAFAGGSYSSSVSTKQRTSTIARNNNAILAINGDASGFRPKSSPYHNPVMIRNGKVEYGLIKGKSIGKMGALTSAGRLVIFDPINYSSTEQMLNEGFTDTWWFDVALVINGQVQNIYDGNQSKYKAPYSAIGQKADGTFLFITVDGRGSNGSAGLNYGGMARLMGRYGAYNAYQLDGGGSTTIWFNGEVLNRPSDGSERAISDIIYVTK